MAAPEGDARPQALPRQQGLLPHGIVGVLHRQAGPVGCRPGQGGAIGGGQVAGQHAHRPAVGHHVVHGEDQLVMAGRQAQQAGAQGRALGQVEGAPHVRFPEGEGAGITLPRRQGGQVVHRQGQRQGRRRHSHGLPILVGIVLRVGGAQNLMPGDDGVQRLLQCPRVQAAVQVQGGGHAVGGVAPCQPVDQPQALLRRRQGQRAAARHGAQDGQAVFRTGDVTVIQPFREVAQGRRLEHRAQRQSVPAPAPQPCHQAGRQQRMAAQDEEVAVAVDGGGGQQVPPQVGQMPFRLRGGLLTRGLVGNGVGQGLAVQLAVSVQGPGGKRHPLRRHHIGWQVGGGVAGQIVGRPVAGRLPIGHQPVAARHHGSAANRRMAFQHGLHLPRFDAEAPDLDLEVLAAGPFQQAFGRPAAQVAGAVDAGAGRAIGVGHEDRCRAAWVAAVAPAHADATNHDLPHRPHGRR
ncbi:hypothetical protein AZA_89897 [Nitrospirillum viridazoti Y2]|nr:hypothetical protein AZA_89897 [Nitrospirillum amazonense Y2]